MGKRLNYIEAIKESEEYLQGLERKQKDSTLRDRVRFLRFLKSGLASSQQSSSDLIGIGVRQGQRIWRLYKETGIEGLVMPITRTGAPCKLTSEELIELEKRLAEDDIQFLHEAAKYIKDEYGKKYTVPGVHYLFKRLEIKKKTGRPTNIRQDKEGLEHFKKTFIN